jgi:casein kinase 1, epsilon
VNLSNNEEVAIKLEPAATKYPQLYYEAKLYKIFDGAGNSSVNEKTSSL